jgi:heme exporter protein A
MRVVLDADNLQCERGGRNLFRSLGFGLRGSELLRIAGANGSGKTSLLRILCGLLSPTQGRILWQGTDISALREEYSNALLYLGHAPAVKDDLTAAENLRISSAIAGDRADEEAIREALARFGLSKSEQPLRRLSQGQRRRAALARLALSGSRPLWLLDEPFSALDAAGIALVRELIDAHLGRGGAVAFTTHQDAGIASAREIDLDRAAR